MSADHESSHSTGMAPSFDLDGFLPYRLNVLATLMSRSLAKVYSQRFGISIPEWRVLVTLASGIPMTQKAIGAQANLDKTQMSRAVSALEARHLVRRAVNEGDRREAFLGFTSKGAALFAEIAPLALDFTARFEAEFTHEELAVFNGIISRLTFALRSTSL